MKRLFILLMICIPIMLAAQIGIEGDAGILYTFANGQVTESGGINYFEFDIMAQATPVEQGNLTRLGEGMMWLYYNTEAFGIDLFTNNNVTVTTGTLLTTVPFPLYSLILNDTGDTHQTPTLPLLAITYVYELDGYPQYGTQLPAVPTQLIHVKFEVQNTAEPAWVCFWDTEMPGESFYSDHWTWYSPVEVGNCLYYDPPLPVELSSFSATFSTDMFVKLTWITQTETNMTGYYILRNTEYDLASAQMVSPLIAATNTSNMQVYEFTDRELYDTGTYYYWLECLEQGSTFHGPVAVNYETTYIPPVDIPTETALNAIFPNPFNPYAFIPFTIGKNSGDTSVKILIYNSRGQMVFSDDLGQKNPGSYTDCFWDGRDNNGVSCSTGLYMIRMIAGKDSFLRKVVMIK